MRERLRIAITKGRLLEKSLELFERAGLDCSPVRDPGRRLIHSIPDYPLDRGQGHHPGEGGRLL